MQTDEPEKNCPHFPRCGGCQLLTTPYREQLPDKKRALGECFAFAKLPALPDIIPCSPAYYYRHKVQLPFGVERRGKQSFPTLGCYAADSHAVIDQHVCVVQDQELSRVAWSIRDWAQSQGIPVYDEKTRQGFLRHVLLRKGAGTGEILVGLVTNSDERPAGMRVIAAALLDRASRALKGSSSTIVGIVQNVNTRQTNVVLGEREFAWWGRPFLFERLGEYRFKAGLSTFFQVNPFQTPVLYDEVLRWIDPGSRVLDVYCGVGSITLWVSKKAQHVTGIEENPASVAAAKKTAEVNTVRNVRFVKGDAGEVFAGAAGEGDVAIFDPPRKGLESSIVTDLLRSSLKRIIYVSCNPETLARDVAALLPAWNLVSLQGVDMFPHTSHLECVAVLDKRAK